MTAQHWWKCGWRADGGEISHMEKMKKETMFGLVSELLHS